MIYGAIFLVGLALMALVVLHRLWRLWRDELSWSREKARRVHEYYNNMRRAGINAERRT